ncbi:MAG: hypothetical protein IIC02_02620 [Planctomycetes bacterium]|nr:hypothetical protein [Planctomycetota bacterium]
MDGQVNHIDGVTNPHDAVPEDGHGPIPPRYWWLKRISIGVGVLLVAVVFLRLWWGWEADRRLQAEIDRIIAAGEPFYPEDYIEIIPDEQNAALLYEEAAGALRADPNSEIDVADVCFDSEECEKHLDEARVLIELNAPVVDFVRRARALPEVSWKNPGVTQAQFAAALVLFSADRQVARILQLAAYLHFRDGNHDQFVETILDMIAHGEAQAQRPILIASLVAWACEFLPLRMIGEYSGELVVDQETASNEIRPVRRRTVESLISVLLDVQGLVGAYNATRNGERTLEYDMYAQLLNPLSGRRSSLAELVFSLPSRVYGGPILTLELARSLGPETDFILSPEESWPATKIRRGGVQASVGLVRSMARPISTSIFQFPMQRTTYLLYKLIMLRRLNATGLAIRLFELDHGGRPETLALLVPDYLPAVPIDPFAADGAEIGYVRESGRDRLYSVGRNGLDDGGERIAGKDILFDKQPDFVLYLDVGSETTEESAPTSSGQTIENNQRTKNKRGDAGDDDDREDQPQHRK